MAIIAMMILPVPSWIVDLGLAISFGLAILIFTLTLFITRTLEFSAFPTLLLATLTLRLSLNVSSTKLIIGNGHEGTDAAGNVIAAFAEFIMSGNAVIGFVVFCVLLIVNFVVITKGATRMAEVGARFALDSMPGKQLAIDSDLASGAIDHDEAQRRRKYEQDETTFYGSLDGASKFVKGDAVAGLLITALNLIVGTCVGILQFELNFESALSTYSILTVGDGLVSQFPAVIISIGSAILLSRGGTTGETDKMIFNQIIGHPQAPLAVSIFLLLLGVLPGLPFIPFFMAAAAAGVAAYVSIRTQKKEVVRPETQTTEQEDDRDLFEYTIDDLRIEIAQDLVSTLLNQGSGINTRIDNLRRHISREYGILLPKMRIVDDASLGVGAYTIFVHGTEMASGILKPGHVMVLHEEQDETVSGQIVREPVYGALASWVPASSSEHYSGNGYTVVAPGEVLMTHLMHTIMQQLPLLLTSKNLQSLFDKIIDAELRDGSHSFQRRISELIPDRLPIERLLRSLRLLLRERVSLRNMPLIIDSAAEVSPGMTSIEDLADHIRRSLAFQIANAVRGKEKVLNIIRLDEAWEAEFLNFEVRDPSGHAAVVLPKLRQQALQTAIEQAIDSTHQSFNDFALLTSSARRRHIHSLIISLKKETQVLSYDELAIARELISDLSPKIVGTVRYV